MASYITFFLLFFLPLVVLPFSVSPFEVPKVIIAEGLITVLVVVTLFQNKLKVSRNQLLMYGGLFLLTLLHLIFFNTNTTFLGNQFRLQGVFLLWHLLLFSLVSSKISLEKIPSWAFLASLGAISLSALAMENSVTGRSIGTLGEANALGAVVIFIWPFVFQKGNLPVKIASIFLTIVTIFLADSRSAFLAFCLQALFLVLATRRKLRLNLAVLVVGLLILASLALPFLERGGVLENRVEIWQTALISGSNTPIFGGGFGNAEHLLKQTSKEVNNNIQYQYVDSSHNFLLDYWLQGGIIGAGLLILLIALGMISFLKKNQVLNLSLLIGLIFVMLFNPLSVVTLLAFWWLIGQSFLPTNHS